MNLYGILSLLHKTLLILLAFTSMNSCARSRMAEAEVTSVNGVPCFSISKQEERRNGQPFLGALGSADQFAFIARLARQWPASEPLKLVFRSI